MASRTAGEQASAPASISASLTLMDCLVQLDLVELARKPQQSRQAFGPHRCEDIAHDGVDVVGRLATLVHEGGERGGKLWI